MNKQKRAEQKKKARREQSKRRVLERRKESREEAREIREQQKLDRLARKIENKLDRLDATPEASLNGLDKSTLKQLEHNVRILKAIEDEYGDADAAKRQLADELEAEGNITLEQKLAALHERQIKTAEATTDDVVGEETEISTEIPTDR